MTPKIMIRIWTTVALATRAPTSEDEDGEAEVVDTAAVVAVEEIWAAIRRRHNTVGTF